MENEFTYDDVVTIRHSAHPPIIWQRWANLALFQATAYSSKAPRALQLVSQTQKLEFRKIFERYPSLYRPEPGQTPQPAQGFSGAKIWKVETPAGPCALRAMPSAIVDQQRLAGLHRLVHHIRACGVCQVPVPIAATDGATVFESGGDIWQLEKWMPGSADFSDDPREVRLSRALTCLARWHLAAARFRPQAVERTWYFSAIAAP